MARRPGHGFAVLRFGTAAVLLFAVSSCRSGSTPGDRSGELGEPCARAEDCGAGLDCSGGICTHACSEAADCAASMACIDGVCGACSASADCPGLFACDSATGACFERCASERECKTSAYCLEGSCAPLLADGEACEGGNECTSGFCTDGVCCDEACDAACTSCNASATDGPQGRCLAVVAGRDPRDDCEAQLACDGAAACHGKPLHAQCEQAYECQPGQCLSGICCDAGCLLFEPGALAALALSATEIEITWSDRCNVEVAYRVERRLGGGGEGAYEVIADALPPDSVSLRDSAVLAETQYDYRVSAVLPSGVVLSAETSGWSGPRAPADLVATAPSPDPLSIVLTWTDASARNSGYVVARRTSSAGDFVELSASLGSEASALTDDTVAVETLYQYRLCAVQEPSTPTCVTLDAYTRPRAPESFAADSPPQSRSLTLRWTNPSAWASGYRLSWRPQGDTAWSELSITDAATLSQAVAALSPNTTYELALVATSAHGESTAVTTSKRTSADPVLTFPTAATLDVACTLAVSGTAALDLEYGPAIAGAEGNIALAATTVGHDDGVSGTLTTLTPGDFSVSWHVNDSLGGSAEATGVLTLLTKSDWRTAAALPALAVGEDGGAGRQVFFAAAPLAGCGQTTQGKRGSVAIGYKHACALTSGGELRCWGSSPSGGLGAGGAVGKALHPVPVVCSSSSGSDCPAAAHLGHVVAVAAGRDFTCALLHDTAAAIDGKVKCWGDNYYGQLGHGDTDTQVNPVPVICGTASGADCAPGEELDEAVALATGYAHACVLVKTGGVKCWGSNGSGQLGDNSQTPRNQPVEVSGISGAIGIAAGAWHTCALLPSSEVRCWGSDVWTQLGQGSATTKTRSLVPVAVVCDASSGSDCTSGNLNQVIGLSLGSYNSCALMDDGSVKCWGRVSGGVTDDSYPRPVACEPGWNPACDAQGYLGGVIAIAAGATHDCALLDGGELACWGDNEEGQLGTEDTSTPYLGAVPVTCHPSGAGSCAPQSPIDDVVAVAAGYYMTCALREGGAVSCFGANEGGQLGDGEDSLATHPMVVTCDYGTGSGCVAGTPFGDAQALAGGGDAACAVTSDGALKCWGSSSGTASNNASYESPGPALGPSAVALTSITEVDLETSHGCAAQAGTVDKKPWCWGLNTYGQVGNGSTNTALVAMRPLCGEGPTCVSGELADIIGVGVGLYHSCAVTGGNKALCWGRNASGQLGIGSTSPATSTTPRLVKASAGVDLTGVQAVCGGDAHTCARIGDTVACWGVSLANGSSGSSSYPVYVKTDATHQLAGVTAVTAGGHNNCALLSNNEARCWGPNTEGELGTGNTTASTLAVSPKCGPSTGGCTAGDNLTNVTSIAMGTYHACAVVGGLVKCWGKNDDAQLGDGTTSDKLYPTPVVCGVYSGAACPAGQELAATAVAVGEHFSCAKLASGGVQCWGWDGLGALGNGLWPGRAGPVPVCASGAGVACEGGAPFTDAAIARRLWYEVTVP